MTQNTDGYNKKQTTKIKNKTYLNVSVYCFFKKKNNKQIEAKVLISCHFSMTKFKQAYQNNKQEVQLTEMIDNNPPSPAHFPLPPITQPGTMTP